MTKFTILAGAFTVGVGFGLQNIFNNFVSGLILLFERPVQIGDVIQLDDATSGIVERIGIRASVVRSSSGSEVIVPNSKLISERVINWTLSDRQRVVEVHVSVVHGSDPKRVIEVMERVAAAHPLVLQGPAARGAARQARARLDELRAARAHRPHRGLDEGAQRARRGDHRRARGGEDRDEVTDAKTRLEGLVD